MAYAVVSDIESEFKNTTFTAGDSVTDTEVTQFIAEEEAVINATIANRYEVPITGTEALLVIKKITIKYVAYRIAGILNLKKAVPIPKEMISQEINEGTAYREAQKMLMAIKDGKIILNDAVARSTVQGIVSYNATNSICPIWEKETQQW